MNGRKASSFIAASLLIILCSAATWGGTLAFSPDGREIAYYNGKKIILVDSVTREPISVFGYESDHIRSIAFLYNQNLMISAGDDNIVRLWEIPSGREIRAFFVLDPHVHQSKPGSTINTIAISPDDKIIATGGHFKNVIIRLWDVSTGRLVRELKGHRSAIYQVAFSPDGKFLASSSFDGTVRLWEVASGREVRIIEGNGVPVYTVCFSPNGKILASAGGDKLIHFWDPRSGKELHQFEAENWVYAIAFSKYKNLAISSGQSNKIELWDIETGRAVRKFCGFGGGIWSIAFSPNGRAIVFLDESRTAIPITLHAINITN